MNENVVNISERLVYRDEYTVLGIANKKSEIISNPKLVACWEEFFSTKASEVINERRAEDGFLGVFCSSDPGYWNYLICGIVKSNDNVPKGMMEITFPESEYVILTHEPVSTRDESNSQIGRLVGYVHSGNWNPPNGYERYYQPIMFIESYPPEENNQFRVELWIPVRKVEL